MGAPAYNPEFPGGFVNNTSNPMLPSFSNPSAWGAMPDFSNMSNWGAGSGDPMEALNAAGISPDAISAALKSGSTMGKLPTTQMPGNNQFKFGMNTPTFSLGISGLQTLSNIWNAFRQTSLAKDQLNYTKAVGNANLSNQIKSYNTNLSDNANTAAVVNGWDSSKLGEYLNKNSLPQSTIK